MLWKIMLWFDKSELFIYKGLLLDRFFGKMKLQMYK